MLSSQKTDQHRLPAVLVYTVLGLSLAPFAYLLVGGSVAPSDAALFQEGLEWSTAVVSFITAFLGYLYLRVRADVLVLTIVLAAFASGSWDALYSMVALGIVEVSSDINRFVHFAWVISRMLKATVLIAGTVYLLGRVSPRLRLGVIWVPTLVLGTLVLGSTFLYLALREGLPGTYYPEAFVTRPWDLPPLVLFALSGLLLYPALLRVQPSLLAGALLLSTVPDTFAQVHVSFGSAYVHDGHFVAAHFLKCLASVVPCLGIAIFFARAFRRETTTAADLGVAVTELKSVGEQLRAEKARLTQLTDNIREVFWVAASDGSEMYYVSPAYEEIFGLTREALLERPDAFLEVVHPEDQEVMTDLLSRDIQDDFEIEFRILRRGELRWLRTRGFPIRDEAGAVYRLAGITEDISEHKRSAEALTKSEARNRALLQAMPDLMFRLNREGVILDYHARDDIQLYRPPSEFLGHNVTEVHAELGPRILACVRDTLETGVMKSMEYRMAIGDQVSDFEARFVQSSEDEVLSVIREITEQKRLERALLDVSNREQQRIGHDLHDGLSQQLTGIALLCRVLHQQLEAKGMEEAAGAARIEDLSLAQSTGSSTHTLLSGDVDNGFLISPEIKLTDVNGDFGVLGGAYGGWVLNRQFLIGGGVYTLANGSGDAGMTYGGGVVEYFVNSDSLVNVSVRGLVGGGSATLDRSFAGFDFERPGRFPFGSIDIPIPNEIGRLFPELGGRSVDFDDLFERASRRFGDRDLDRLFGARSTSFFIAEPEVGVNVNISERLRLSLGGGYRFIGGAGALSDRLDGFTAHIALKASFF